MPGLPCLLILLIPRSRLGPAVVDGLGQKVLDQPKDLRPRHHWNLPDLPILFEQIFLPTALWAHDPLPALTEPILRESMLGAHRRACADRRADPEKAEGTW